MLATTLAIRPRRRALLAALIAGEMLVAAAASIAGTQPALAQSYDRSQGFHFFPFFDNGRRQQQYPQQQPWFQQQQPWGQAPAESRPQIDYSKAPPPRKLDSQPALHVLVLGDAMADWLGFGLEDAFGETPEIGVVRKHHANGGLIHNDSRNAYDWPQAAREILAADKPDFIVMMIGASDRQAIRERQVKPAPPGKPPNGQGTQPQAQPSSQQAARASDKPVPETPPPGDETAPVAEEQPSIATSEPTTKGVASSFEFKSEKWAELYAKRVDEMIALLKSKGVPVFWVGLPSLRGTHATSDIAYLNDIYRGRAEKAGIVFVDIWDGFVDESGVFTVQGPDFEGQTRRLRSGDGVYFTKAGARKLAHYVEREIRHAMLSHGAPVASPTPEESQPQALGARPGTAPSRPAAGPVVPLTTLPVSHEGLLGGGPVRSPAVESTASRVLIKGEPLPALSGRADDFAWPRSEGAMPSPPPVPAAGAQPPEPPPAAKSEAVSPKPSPAAAAPASAATAPAPAATTSAPAATGPATIAPKPPAQKRAAARPEHGPQRIMPSFTEEAVRPPGAIPTR